MAVVPSSPPAHLQFQLFRVILPDLLLAAAPARTRPPMTPCRLALHLYWPPPGHECSGPVASVRSSLCWAPAGEGGALTLCAPWREGASVRLEAVCASRIQSNLKAGAAPRELRVLGAVIGCTEPRAPHPAPLEASGHAKAPFQARCYNLCLNVPEAWCRFSFGGGQM